MASSPLAVEPHPSRSRSQSATAPRQALLNWDDPIEIRPTAPRAHTTQHNPGRQPGLQRACLAILELLSDGRPHAWHELLAVAGSRYNARVSELRKAGHVVLGPRAWERPDGTRCTATLALGSGGAERYELDQRVLAL